MIDAQPSSATVASLIVLVTGHLIVDGNTEQPMPYSQMFQVSFFFRCEGRRRGKRSLGGKGGDVGERGNEYGQSGMNRNANGLQRAWMTAKRRERMRVGF